MAAKSLEGKSRREKGAALAAAGAAYAVARQRWHVDSSTGEGFYTVTTTGTGKGEAPVSCTCLDYRKRGGECKHMAAVVVQAMACNRVRAAARAGQLGELHASTVARLASAEGGRRLALLCLVGTAGRELADLASVARERLARFPA